MKPQPERRIYADRVLTSAEKSRRHKDRLASIDDELNAAFGRIDLQRKTKAEKGIVEWTRTYAVGQLLDDPPPPKGEEVLEQMERAIDAHGNYMICMGRGMGKSSYALITAVYALATGRQKYVVIISNSSSSAASLMTDIYRFVSATGTAFAQDYPDINLPFVQCGGSFRRRQMYNGVPTDITRNAKQVVFATLARDGKKLPSSGSVVEVRGISSGLRGMKHGTLRPSLVLLDDLQTSETAANPEQVKKLIDAIKKDIMPLAGKERLSIIQTATPICPDDLVEQIRRDINWTTATYPSIMRYPKDMAKWDEYLKLYDKELIDGTSHRQSLEFYRTNRAEMDEGGEVFNPSRFSKKDGHVSALQKLMELRHQLGSAFDAEYQMRPKKYSCALDISPKTAASKMNGLGELVIPDGTSLVVASSDLNLSYAISSVIVAFRPDMTASVIWHGITKTRLDYRANDTEFSRAVYDALAKEGRKLKELCADITGWGIDAGGRPFETVCQFAKSAAAVCGVPACAMAGKAAHVFNPFIKTRLRESLNRTVLCGDPREHIKAGSGNKYTYWDSDHYRAAVQQALLSEVGSPGSCTLYGNTPDEHIEFANQICNERLQYIKHRQDGRDEYKWKSAEPHDYLDATAQAFAIAASQGISGRRRDECDERTKRIQALVAIRHRQTKSKIKVR